MIKAGYNTYDPGWVRASWIEAFPIVYRAMLNQAINELEEDEG